MDVWEKRKNKWQKQNLQKILKNCVWKKRMPCLPKTKIKIQTTIYAYERWMAINI